MWGIFHGKACLHPSNLKLWILYINHHQSCIQCIGNKEYKESGTNCPQEQSFSQVRKETRETDKHINVYKDRQKRKKGILLSYQSLIREEVKGVIKSVLWFFWGQNRRKRNIPLTVLLCFEWLTEWVKGKQVHRGAINYSLEKRWIPKCIIFPGNSNVLFFIHAITINITGYVFRGVRDLFFPYCSFGVLLVNLWSVFSLNPVLDHRIWIRI